ncbi:hypothetical protein OAO96_06680 [Amylibacter sp.]|nr:hypothetical protein [Amylibacter sp.]
MDTKIHGYQTVSYRHPHIRKVRSGWMRADTPQVAFHKPDSPIGLWRWIEQWQQLGSPFRFNGTGQELRGYDSGA